MSDAEEDRIIAEMGRRLRLRALLIVLVSLATAAIMFILVVGFHVLPWPLRWAPFLGLVGFVALIGIVGSLAVAWVTRLPPEAVSARITLRNSDHIQRIVSRIYMFYPLIMGVTAFDSAVLVHRVLHSGWRFLDVSEGVSFLVAVAFGYVPFLAGRGASLSGWGVGRWSRLIQDEELFQSFRTRGYVIGFWSVMAGLLLVLALGLARPAWAVEALPVLIAVGVSAPAVTIALLNRRAERDA